MRQHIGLAVIFGLFACTANPSRLEQISQEQAVAAVGPLPLPPLAVTLPATPAGFDAALWRDIGWFPGDVTEVSGFVGPASQYMARWLESSLVPDAPACAPLIAGIERTYQAQQQDGRVATNVFYGSMTREQERVCLAAARPAMGITAEQTGNITVLRAEGAEARLAWYAAPHGTVVILEGDRPLADWGQPRGTMAPALIQQLAAADRREGTWSVSLRDVGTAFTGVASVGYMLWIAPMQRPDRPLIEGVARVQYASPDDARRAEEGAAAFAREIVGPEDPGVSFEIRLTGAVLMVVFRGTPNADITALTAWFERTQAAMRTRLDAGPPG